MKKNVFYFIACAFIALSSVTFISCDKDDPDPDPVVNPEPDPDPDPTPTAANPLQLVNAIYGPLQTLSSSYSFLVESATETTISFEERDDSKDGPQVSVFETVPGNWYPIKVFNRLYQSISAANLAIETITALPVSETLTQANKDLYLGLCGSGGQYERNFSE